MNTWQASSTLSLQDRVALCQKTAGAIRALARFATPARLGEVEHTLFDLLSAEDRGAPLMFHPDVFHWYFQFRLSFSRENHDRLMMHIDHLPETKQSVVASTYRAHVNEPTIGAAIDLDPHSMSVHAALARGEQFATKLGRTPVNLVPVVPDDRELSLLREAFAILRTVWPSAHGEVQDFVRRAVFFEGRVALGFTEFRCNGTIFLRRDRVSDPVEFAEEILHEASHVRLNSALAISPMILNDDKELYSSPLRQDPRPMFGVFHQMFVLTRLSHYYSRLVPIAGSQHTEKLVRVTSQLAQALDVVNLHATLTDTGTELVASANQQLFAARNEIRALHG